MKFWHIAIISGVLLSLAFPPYNLVPIAFVALVPLLLFEKKWSKDSWNYWKVFLNASLFFFCFNVFTTWWVYNAALAGVIAGALYNTILMSFAFASRSIFRKAFGERLVDFAFISTFIAVEYFHLNLSQLDFPWMIFGNALADSIYLIQWYEFTGVLGGSLWILLINVILFRSVESLWLGASLQDHNSGLKKSNVVLALLLLILPAGYSFYQFNSINLEGKEVDVAILQPNVDPYKDKFSSDKYAVQLDSFISRSVAVMNKETDLLIWPETSIPGYIYLKDNNWQEAKIRSVFLQYPQASFLGGAMSVYNYGLSETASETARVYNNGRFYDVYNSALFYQQGIKRQEYFKSKLVIGVEKMPYAALLKPLSKLIVDLGGTTGQLGRQDQREVFKLKNGQSVAPIICYESIYGQFVTSYIKEGATILSIITNDAWWGDTPGYKQHLAYARMRAIECRRDVVRSANTGISAHINRRGEILIGSNYWEDDAFQVRAISNEEITMYVRHGDFLGRFALILSSLLLLIAFVRKRLVKFKTR